MFPNERTERGKKTYRLAVVGLSLLSTTALAITIWILVDFQKEQAIVGSLMQDLPRRAQGPAKYLAGELRWQFRLTILVVINLIVTSIALILLWRAYHASQASLRDFKAFAGDVLSTLDLGIVTTDSSGKVTSINPRGIELLDTHPNCIEKPIEQLNSVPLQEYIDDWMVTRSPVMNRDFRVEQQGNTRLLRAYCQILKDHEGNDAGHVVQLRDETERALIEERMRRMERYMGLGSLAGGLHHEIKNPLAALSLHVQLLEEQLEADGTSDENRRMLGVIRTEVTRIGGVLESFRDFASIDLLNATSFNLVATLRQQIELMQPHARQQGVQILFNPCESESIITADPNRIEQVFLNLIINALEAMPDGGTLTISTQRTARAMRIDVADTGDGIPSNLADKVFDPYFTTKGTGTGLGLALCDKIVRQHQGTLEFCSSNDGTTFKVTLPMLPTIATETRTA